MEKALMKQVVGQPKALKNKHQLQSISDQLSSLELPQPSVITKLQLQEQDQKVIGNRDAKLSSMEMSDPEVLVLHESKTNWKYQTNALQASLASLNLPVPGMMMQANLGRMGFLLQAQVVNLCEVKGAVIDGFQMEINYNKLIKQFGTKRITPQQPHRFKHLTQRKLHPLLRRGIIFSHYLDVLLNLYEQGKLFYLYTGRGPSTGSMHLGHMVPFIVTHVDFPIFDTPY
ncbi:hypothetical protein PCANC_10539 [Puccinia coronata f. sp. avenae]|uniref:Tryptophanyl-tRNA synthetase n=1 Tax=Puccinia coronata f. sp. avenae TaxID=200324 RepID=A0A2N5VZD7_9BASI|nr:hypothetical protein PCANC_10539 [Puccinia coronata f. sp. avenae]